MFNPRQVLSQVKNDNEALLIISTLGSTTNDWPFIRHMGGPQKILCSDLFEKMLIKKAAAHPLLKTRFSSFRTIMDSFYAQNGYLCTPLGNPRSRLFTIPHAPLVFFGYLNPLLVDRPPSAAIVGSRDACERGCNWSKSLAAFFAQKGIHVVSGGARGIDRAAHEGVLESGGTTCQVSGLACNFIKPHSSFFSGYDPQSVALIHPFGPFFPQAKYMFVERNKFVAGLSDALIVVQGRKGSGTLHTVLFAEALNIPIYAIPGAIDYPLSYVPNLLLQKGKAKALIDFEQIAEALVTNGVKGPKKHKKAFDDGQRPLDIKPLPELVMLIKNHGNSLSMSEILTMTGKGFLPAQKELLELELSGQIVKRGSQFVLTGN